MFIVKEFLRLSIFSLNINGRLYMWCQVDAASEPSGYIPLHLACITGHVGVVGLLLSRSTELLKVTDNAGRTCLHVAAASGHYDMVQVCITYCADETNIFFSTSH